jgi:hypothetical protein
VWKSRKSKKKNISLTPNLSSVGHKHRGAIKTISTPPWKPLFASKHHRSSHINNTRKAHVPNVFFNIYTSASKNNIYSTWGSSCCGQSCDLFRPRPRFDPLCARLSPPRCLTCSWACRMSSGLWGIVVVRVSWPGHPT